MKDQMKDKNEESSHCLVYLDIFCLDIKFEITLLNLLRSNNSSKKYDQSLKIHVYCYVAKYGVKISI